ncbi:MAG: hypothetical protein IH989_02530, partial [Planctomycetes bacterium]|nr:hypothetical protein [Planctomycetota bacterium]
MTRSSAPVTIAVMVLLIGLPASADPIIELRPISASGPHAIAGNQITLDEPGQRIFLEVFIADWDPDLDGIPLLAGFQASLDSSGYSSGTLGQLVTANVLCTEDAECETAFGPLATCGYPFHPGECTPGFQDLLRDDWILNGVNGIPAMDLGTPDFRWAGAVVFGGVADSGTPRYVGTLVLDVPLGTIGTFTLGFNPEPSSSLQDSSLVPISPLVFVPATILIACGLNADCDDGNACTDDTCLPNGSCSSQTNYNDTVFCCNPADRTLTALDDGNACTVGTCDPTDGSVSQDPLPSGTTCGNSASDVCDAQDTCDGNGVCVDQFAPSGTACGNPASAECNMPDTCDGAGVCLSNVEPSGAPCGDPADTTCNPADTCDGLGACVTRIATLSTLCGDPSDTECDDPDTCDGAGLCLSNAAPGGLLCGDPIGDQCDNPDSCDGTGACLSNPVATGVVCGNPGTTECDNPDACDGAGACNPNHLADDSLCSDDGNECRDDVCLSGVCSHPLTPAGVSCGDPSATECDGADSCDGAGTCQTNLQPTGAACGDPTTTDCDRADSCDGGGTCLTHLEPTGSACGDPSDTDCDAPDTCDGLGICLANVAPTGLPCGNSVGNQCDDPDSCDGAGLCEPNFVLAGTACGNPADSECDNPDTCDGDGVCEPNHELDGTLCSDDGNDCRDDTCLGGVCSHPLSIVGTPCGDPTATDCNDPDACDGAGTCLPALVSSGTLCGDPSSTLCTAPDTCDGFGTCLPNDVPDTTSCDDGSFCETGATCLAGLCGGGSAIDCDDGLPCTVDSCNELAQQCDHDLIAGSCLIAGACFADGQPNPDNDCQVCDSFLDATDWTLLPAGSACDDRDPCTGTGDPGIGFDACDAVGLCTGTTDPNCNDDCINAVPVFDGANLGNNENRGPDDDEALCQFDSDNDVWFVYDALCTGPVSMDTIGSAFAPSNDTVLTVYEICGGQEVACDDDGGPGLLSLVAFNALAGQSYFIR